MGAEASVVGMSARGRSTFSADSAVRPKRSAEPIVVSVAGYIMVGSFVGTDGGWPEGNLQPSVRQARPASPPPQIELSVDRSATLDRDGVATVSGSLACNQRLFGTLEAVMQQTFGHRHEANA